MELWVQSTLEHGGLWAEVLQLLTQMERARQVEDTASLPQRDTGQGRKARGACSHYSSTSALTWGRPDRPDWQCFGFGVTNMAPRVARKTCWEGGVSKTFVFLSESRTHPISLEGQSHCTVSSFCS